MGKNNQMMWVIIVGVAAVVLFMGIKQPAEDTKPTTENGVSLKIIGWRDGVRIGELSAVASPFSVVQYDPVGGGPTLPDIDAVSIQHTVSQLPAADVDVDINDVTGSFTATGAGDLPIGGDARYETALNAVTRAFLKVLGIDWVEESDPFDVTELEDDCNVAPYCKFKLQLDASFDDIDPNTGQMITSFVAPENSFGDITLMIRSEQCSDNTPFGQCSNTVVGQFCDGLAGLIDCANPTGCTSANYGAQGCDCAAGYAETDGDAICTALGCVSGAIAPGECTGDNAMICGVGCAVEGGTCPTELDCIECGQAGQSQGTALGWLDAVSNAAECPFAYDGVTTAYECHNVQGTCKYHGRKPDLTILLE